MKNLQWDSVYSVFEKMEVLTGKLSVETDEVDSLSESSVTISDDELIIIRNDIRTQLDLLRTQLLVELTERDCYFVLFPIVVLFDELVQSQLFDRNLTSWPPLQKELFQIDDAGEVFYETLDEILRKPQTLPFIYEVYYFCLNHGFKGKYIENPEKINEFKKILKNKIQVNKPEISEIPDEETGMLKQIGNSLKYYAAACAAVIVFYLFFNMIALNSDFGLEAQGINSIQQSSAKPLIHYKNPAPSSLGRGD